MALFKFRATEGTEGIRYHISDNDYYWLASRFCQNMMAFVFSAARYNQDKSIYFEHFFIDFLDRKGISYSIVHIDESNKQLCIIKPWEKAAVK